MGSFAVNEPSRAGLPKTVTVLPGPASDMTKTGTGPLSSIDATTRTSFCAGTRISTPVTSLSSTASVGEEAASSAGTSRAVNVLRLSTRGNSKDPSGATGVSTADVIRLSRATRYGPFAGSNPRTLPLTDSHESGAAVPKPIANSGDRSEDIFMGSENRSAEPYVIERSTYAGGIPFGPLAAATR